MTLPKADSSGVFVDNDAALKSCQYSLQEEVAQHFGGMGNIFVLDSAFYSLHLNDGNKALTMCGSAAVVDALNQFVACANKLSPNQSLNTAIVELTEVTAIDAGEALLFAAAAKQSSCIVFTGDKRAIAALAKSSHAIGVKSELIGKIKCLEQVVAELIEAFGYKKIASRIMAAPRTDTALRACFSSGSETSTIHGLRSYYNSLKASANGLLASPPQIIT